VAGFSDWGEDAVLNAVFRGIALTGVGTLYISLHNGDPTDANVTSTELPIGTNGYSRVAWASNTTNWSPPQTAGSARQVANAANVIFGLPTGDWNLGNPVTHVGIYTAATAGNLVASGVLGTPRTVLVTDNAPTFGPGALVFSLD
jgi:hypothetical protein